MYDLAHHAHQRVFVPCITSKMILEEENMYDLAHHAQRGSSMEFQYG